MSAQTRTAPKLRRPFAAIQSAAVATSKTVNNGIDYCIASQQTIQKNIMSTKYVKMTTKSIEGFSSGVNSKIAPYTAKAEPFVRPVVPYINKAKPYVPPAILATILISLPPVLCVLGFLAFITAPIWITIGFLTAFIWIPVVVCSFFVACFVAFIGTVRYLSTRNGQKLLKNIWAKITSTKMGKQIFYVSA